MVDNVLTFGDQTSGNEQIWGNLGKSQYTLNADGTATVIEGATDPEPSADPGQGNAPSYPKNSLVLDFTADVNEQM